jgi:hypothetical protein
MGYWVDTSAPQLNILFRLEIFSVAQHCWYPYASRSSFGEFPEFNLIRL